MQVFLPALPSIQARFGVSAASAQLVFSLSAFSIAVSMLFYGPISDRFGRRPALIGGLIVYLAGSVMCAVAPSIAVLIVGRIVQAAGGCAGIVLSRAIVRDLYSLDRSASVLAYITMAMVAAPMMAPALGGLLTDLAGWRSVFVAGTAVGVLILVAVHGGLPETAGSIGRRPVRHPLQGFGKLLRSATFLGYALQGAFSICSLLRLPGGGTVPDAHGAAPPGQRVRADVRPGLRRVHGRELRSRPLLGPDRRPPHDPAGQPGGATGARSAPWCW